MEQYEADLDVWVKAHPGRKHSVNQKQYEIQASDSEDEDEEKEEEKKA